MDDLTVVPLVLQSGPAPALVQPGPSQVAIDLPQGNDTHPYPSSEAVDRHNIGGYDKVCALAEYLVTLKNQTGALSNQQAANAIRLWGELEEVDKIPIVFPPRNKDRVTEGRFKSPMGEDSCCACGGQNPSVFHWKQQWTSIVAQQPPIHGGDAGQTLQALPFPRKEGRSNYPVVHTCVFRLQQD